MKKRQSVDREMVPQLPNRILLTLTMIKKSLKKYLNQYSKRKRIWLLKKKSLLERNEADKSANSHRNI